VDETGHELDTIAIVKKSHGYAVITQDIDISRKVPIFPDDDRSYAELKDRSSTHHARAQRRLHCDAFIPGPPSSMAEAIHFTMRSRIAVLHSPVVSGGNQVAVLHHDSANRKAAFVVGFQRLFESEPHESSVAGRLGH
jgi:hypothetical protein